MSRTPTEKQYWTLITLGSGSAGMSRRKRDTDPLLRWGWVSAEFDGSYYQMVRLTPEGFAALGRAVQKYGLPSLRSRLPPRRVCADCGSTAWRIEEAGE